MGLRGVAHLMTSQVKSAPSSGDGLYARAEDPRARIAELFQAHALFVWRVLRRMGVAESDVEDVCQDVFLTVHRRFDTFEGRSNSRTWIYAICLRTAANYRRREWRRREEALCPPEELALTSRPQEPTGVRDLDRALSSLSEAKRTVFVLYEFGGLSTLEVAAVIGCPVKTCFSRLHAARRELRVFLEAGGRP
jgi:RNA polymerase sigma-70 factor (ECF subfamily)